jgi:sigma-E factor negative regulatory protein RseC
MQQKGRVISSDSDYALVQVMRETSCGENCKSCGTNCASSVLISTSNSIDAKQGDFVDIYSDTSKILATIALAYIVPLIIVISGIFISKRFIAYNEIEMLSDVIALVIGIILYAISLFLIHIFSKNKTIKYYISKT